MTEAAAALGDTDSTDGNDGKMVAGTVRRFPGLSVNTSVDCLEVLTAPGDPLELCSSKSGRTETGGGAKPDEGSGVPSARSRSDSAP